MKPGLLYPNPAPMLLPLLLLLAADSAEARNIAVAPAETLHTVAMGQGDPVVLIPGLLGGAYGYRRVMPGLAGEGYRVIAVEPLGWGESARPKHADYSLTSQAQRLEQVLDTMGLTHVWLVAHSLGGAIALRLAALDPGLVRGILLIDAGPAENAAPPGLKRAMRFAPLLKLFVGRGTIRRSIRSGIIGNSGDTSWVTPEVIDSYTAGPGKNVKATIDAFHGMARSQEPDSLSRHLAAIRVPVRLLIGTVPHQSGVDAEDTARLAALLPDFQIDSVAGAGQFIHEEQPGAVIEAIAALTQGKKVLGSAP
jgi:pimeloyl-ACP methyl ester carboxylesterase